MANPRYIGRNNEPTSEMLSKLEKAKFVYYNNIDKFCEDSGYTWATEELKNISEVYLVGSHASYNKWKNDTSDIDIAIVVPDSVPEISHQYKRKVLDNILCPRNQEKRRWIDIFSLRESYQVLEPRVDLTDAWNKLDISNLEYKILKKY